MSTTVVNSTAGLNSALASATAGETILLAPGTYTGISAYDVNPSGGVTITSEYSSQQAVLGNFTLNECSNLTFSNLEFSTVGSTDAYYGYRIYNDTNIQFNSDFVHGAIGGDPNTAITGFLIENSAGVSVTNSTFEYLQNGIMELDNNGVNVSNNTFEYLAADGIDNAGTSNVQITNNYFTDMVKDTIGLHPDCIQFWTAGTTEPVSNITISGNTYVRGNGVPVQGIFMGNENSLPYSNLTITNNTVTGGLYNGITVDDATSATVTGNNVISYVDQPSWIVLNSDNGGTYSNNAATLFMESGDTNLSMSGNTINSAIPVPTLVSGTGSVTVTSTTTTTTTTTTSSGPPGAPTGLVLDASTASGAAGSDITKDAQVVIDGSAAAGSTVTLYDGTTVIGSGVANATTGAFSIQATSPLANGTHSLTAVATVSGQTSAASSVLSVIVDTQPATAALTHVSGSEGSGSSITLTGTASDAVAGVGYTVSILQDGTKVGTVTPTNGAWTFTETNVSSAVHTYTVSTTDAAANTGAGTTQVILGTSGNDHIVGGAGNNIIDGGLGTDTLTGGSGTNTFIYNSVNDAPVVHKPETITNWVSGSDHIDLTGLGHLTFGGQTQAVTPDSVEWYVSGGNTYVVGDALGSTRADFMIELIGVHNLSASDFVLH